MWRLVQVSRNVSGFARGKAGLAIFSGYSRAPCTRTHASLRRCRLSSTEAINSQAGQRDEFTEKEFRSSAQGKPFQDGHKPFLFSRNKSHVKSRLRELVDSGEGNVEGLLKTCSEDLLLESPSVRAALVDEVWETLASTGGKVPLDVASYNALIASYLHTSREFCPKEFLIKMQENEIMPNTETLYLLLLRYCNQGDKEGAKTILEHMQNAGMPITEKVYHALIKCHGRANDMAGAHSVFDALSDKGISVTEESFGALAVAYAEQGNIDGVMKILDKMSETRVFPSHRGFLNILRALAPHPQHIPHILQVIKNKKYMIADLCRLMVDCASQGHFDAAFNLLSVIVDYSRVFNRALLERSVTMVTSHMMNSNVSNDMVFELSQRLSPLDGTVCRQPRENLLLYLSKQDDPDIAVRYARELDTRGIPIRTHYLFPVLVKGITAGNSEQVVRTLQAMMDLHLNMSDHNLINLFQPNEGENYMLQCFEEAGLMKDSKFMCELIQYFWVQKHPDISLKLLFTLPLNEDVRQLLRDGYTPTIGNSLKLVATAMVDEGDISDAVVTTLKLAEMDFLPPSSNVTIALILKKLAIKGDRAEFFQFLGKLKDLRFPLSDQVLKEVIHFASTIGDIDKCMVTFNQLQIRNGASYSELLRALCLQRRVPQAESCYREMLAQGFKPHRNHMAQYIKLFLDMGDTKAAEDYRKEMEGFGYDIHHSLRQEFIKTYCMKGDFDKAKAEIRDVLPLLQELNYSVVFPRILLMKGYLSHGSPEGVRETLDEMKEEEVTIEPPQIGLLLEGYMNSMDQESILNLIQTAKDTYGVPPSMVSILRVLNKLVAMDDYDTATEVVGHLKALYEQSEDAIAHVMLFAELLAGHKEKALDMAMTKSFAADKQRLLGFIKHLRQINKKEMVEVVKKIIDFHQDGESDPE